MSERPRFDVVIPTVRLDPTFLSPLLNLDGPPGISVRYFVVVDRPGEDRDESLSALLRREDVTVLVNDENLGAAESRNRGLDAGDGDFVLFLDDDVFPQPGMLGAYLAEIEHDPVNSPGYVGVTRFPPPVNRFTRGVAASDILTFFDIAGQRSSIAWGVTANLCVRRSAVEDVRFRPEFPKEGGGEDIDFCLRVSDRSGGRLFRCVAEAVVVHPWWRGGERSYQRFFRWAYGDSRLPLLHPHLGYRNAPSLPEMSLGVAAMLPILAATGRAILALWFFIGAVLIEFLIEYLRLRFRNVVVDPRTSIEATLIRLSNDVGRFASNLRSMRFGALLQRFDYFATGESIQLERYVAGAKLLGWCLVAGLIFLLV